MLTSNIFMMLGDINQFIVIVMISTNMTLLYAEIEASYQ